MTIRRLLSFAVLSLFIGCACPEKGAETPTGGGGGVTPPGDTPETTPETTPTPPPAAELPSKPGEKCTADGGCADGLTCIKYYGVAGPHGPEFASCEVPCPTPTSECPDGMKCVTISDGPGAVCR